MPDWLPPALYPADWLVIKILAMLFFISLIIGIGSYFKGGGYNV